MQHAACEGRRGGRREDCEADCPSRRSHSSCDQDLGGAPEAPRVRGGSACHGGINGAASGLGCGGGGGRRRRILRDAAWALLVILVACGGQGAWAEGERRQGFDENQFDAISTVSKACRVSSQAESADRWCSRCDNTTRLWFAPGTDPTWITFDQIFARPDTPEDVDPKDGSPVVRVNGQNFENNQYHYFEFIVQGGDGSAADLQREDEVAFTLVSPGSIQVANGAVVANSEYAARKPAYDFFIGQNCIPQERSWNNQGYGNLNANELVKSLVVNVTRDARYFIALQSRRLRYGVATFDSTMNLTRGSLKSQFRETACTPLMYKYPDEVARMQAEYRQTGVIAKQQGGAVPPCGETPQEKRYNVKYLFPTPAPGLSQKNLAIVVGAVCGAVVFISLVAGSWLFVRYKRTTQRMAKFSSLSRGLPDALMDGEGQEVAV